MPGVVADKVIVELEAKLDRYNANVLSAEKQFGRSTKAMQDAAGRTEATVRRAFGGLTGLLAGVSTIAAAREFLKYADAAKTLEAQLKLATAQTGSFAQAQEDVRRISVDTRSGLEETAKLYGNFLRNARELGITQEQAARATQTVSETFKISGTSAQDSAAGTLQLVQALQSGVLRGDEFNSVMENAPRLARLLATSLGVPVGALRAMAEAGTLTAATLTKALTDTRFTAGIDAEFKQIPVTFDQAMGQIENAAIITFGAFDRGGQFSTALSNFILDGANGFTSLEDAAESFGVDVRATLAGLGTAFAPFQDGGIGAIDAISARFKGLRGEIADLLGALDYVRNFGRDLPGLIGKGTVLGFGPGAGAKPPAAFDSKGAFLKSFDRSQSEGRANSTDRKINKTFGGPGFDRYLNEPGRYDVFGNPKGGTPKPTALANPKAASAAAAAAKKAETERLAAERKQQAFDNELANSQRDLVDARKALVTSAETLVQLDRQNIETERTKYNDNLLSLVSRKQLTASQAEQLRIINDQTAALKQEALDLHERQRISAERTAAARAGVQNEIDMQQSLEPLANTNDERRRIALRLLDLQYEQERIELRAITVANGRTQAEEDLAKARLAQLDALKSNAVAAVERQHDGPIAAYRRGLDDPKTQVQQAVADKLQAVDDGITNAIAGKLGVKDPFLKQLLKIFLEQNIIKPLYDAVASAQGGASGGGGFFGSLLNIGKSVLGGTSGGGSGDGGLGAVFGGGSQGNSHGVLSLLGFRASGGHVSAGQLYGVNERGVEGFRPSGSGQIIPLGRMRPTHSGGMVLHQTVRVDARGSVNPDGYAEHIRSAVRQDTVAIVSRAAQLQSKAVPGRIAQYQTDGT